MPPDPPNRLCLYKLHIHVTPLLKILATGLRCVHDVKLIALLLTANSCTVRLGECRRLGYSENNVLLNFKTFMHF